MYSDIKTSLLQFVNFTIDIYKNHIIVPSEKEAEQNLILSRCCNKI